MSTAELAAAAVAPELVIPLETARTLVREVRGRRARQELALAAGNVVLVPPPERPPLLSFGKDKVRVRVRRGITIVSVDRAPSIGAGEAIAIVAVGGAAYLAYRAEQQLANAANSVQHAASWLNAFNPSNWKLP